MLEWDRSEASVRIKKYWRHIRQTDGGGGGGSLAESRWYRMSDGSMDARGVCAVD